MKEHLLHSVKKLCGLIVGLVIAFNSQAVQLSGSYTINPSAPATVTNFKDFMSAVNYLTSATIRPDGGPSNAAPFGISASVTFTVSAGTYVGQVIVPAITGTSATKTVTFDGVNAATRIVSDSGNRAAFIVNQASYITVKNLTVNNIYAGTASGIALVGNVANNAGVGFTVKGCIVNLPNVGTTTSYGIVVTGNATGTGDANQYTDSVTIDSNTTNGGYYGIQISTSGNINASYNRGHRITGNTINNAYYYGIRAYYLYNAVVIMNNNITMNPTNVSSYGIYFYYCQNASTTISSVVSGNKVLAGYTALYNYYTSTAGGAPCLVYNNIFRTNGSCYATMYQAAAAGATVKIFHNTIYGNGPSGTYGGLYFTTMTAAGTEVKNNIFIVDGAAMYPVYFGSAVPGNFLNYNNYYNKQGGVLGYRGGVNFPASFKTVTAGGDTSFNLNLGLDAALASIDGCIPQGVDLTATVPTDIEGDIRAITPRIGADEYNGVNNDLSIDKIISPLAPVTLGLQDLAIRVKNTGNTVITSFNLNYKNNALAVKTQAWAGTLNPCDTITLTFTGADQINLLASNAVSIYTSLPNGIADGKRSNDTLKATYLTPLSGTYTIGATGTYPNFTSAISALNIAGLTGPVTFNVQAGTYTGQVLLSGTIPGLSVTNTVTFDGIDATTRIITDSGNRAAVLVNQLSYITFKNLTVTNTFAGVASGIALVGNIINNAGVGFTVKKCVVNLPNVGTGTSYGIIVTGSQTGTSDVNQYTDSVWIDSNTVNGGYYGIQISTAGATGNSNFNRGHRITGNTINNAYYYGIRAYYLYNPVIIMNNKITMNPTNVSSYGIYFYYCQNPSTTISSVVSGNKVLAGYTALYNYYTSTAGGAACLVYNNIFRTNGSCYATMYQAAAAGATVKIFHNTIYGNGPAGTYGGLYFTTMTAAGTEVKNNIFMVDGAAMYPVYFGSAVPGNFLNYNNYYNKQGGILGYRGGVNFPASFKTATAGGDTSFNLNLGLDAAMASIDACIPQGVNLTATVPTDIDGDIRAITPRIGADEYNGVANDLAIDKLITPAQPVTAGLQDLVVRVKNLGNTTITSFNTSYKNNTGTTITQPWAGTLAPCDTVSITFTGADQITIGASNNIMMYTSSPNAIADNKRSNDTLKTRILTPLSGSYTIGATGTFPTFAAATVALVDGGLAGPVTFTVQPGTYNERVVVPQGIAGVSATNTITFDGINAATRIVKDSSGQAAFTVNQASYVTIKNLTVTNSFHTLSTGIALIGNTMNNAGTGFTVKNCTVNLPNVPNGTTSYGIIVTGNPLGTSDVNQWTDSVTIDSNTINGGYYGIQISTASIGNASYNRDHKVRYNTVNSWYYGIRINYIFNPIDVSFNKVNMHPDNVNSYGVYVYYNQAGAATASTKINNNKIYAGYAGLYDYYGTNTSATYPKQIYNNMITTFAPSAYVGMYIYTGATGGSISQIYHNSVNMLGASATNGLYYYNNTGSTTATMIKNNIFKVVGSASYPAYFSTSPASGTVNYNNYYNTGGVRLGYRGADFTVANYKLATTGGDSSFNSDPIYMTNTDLHTNNACTKGVDLTAFVPADMDGDIRSLTPIVGADETAGLANDIGIDKVYISAPITPGLQDLSVRIKNFSPNATSSATISYSINNGTPVSMPWTGTMLGCGDTALITFTGAQQINIAAGFNSLKVYTSSPNATIDNYKNNDTAALALSTITKVNGNAFVGNGTGGFATGSAVRFDSKPQMIGNASTKFSMEAWVKVSAWSDQKFIAKSSVSNGFALGVDPTGRLDAEIWTVANGTGSVRVTTQGTSYPTNIIPLNTWTHVAATWESGVGVRMYINGSLVGFLNSATATTISQSTNDLYVGSNSWDGGHAVNGSIDEVRLWSVALDSVAIRRHMYSALTGTETGINTYIQFNEPTNSTNFSDVIGASTGYKGVATVIAPSTLPFGGDSTMTLTAVTSGLFANKDVTVSIYEPFDNASDLTITEILGAPNALPAATNKYSVKYWNIKAFGNPGVFAADLTFSSFPIGYLNTTDAALGLYRRDNNSDGAWTLAKLSGSITGSTVTFNAVDTFGQFTVASNGTSALPVSLLSFGAKAGDDLVNVNWSTANEISCSHFEVERAYETSEDFETIGTVKGAGNSTKVLNYMFVDKGADLHQTIYYRLKQVDMDGKYSYSPIAVVKPAIDENNKLEVYPNPFNTGVNVSFVAATAEAKATIKVMNIAGKTVHTESVNTVSGRNNKTIDLADLQSGVYFISIELNGATTNLKLVKN